MLLEIQFTKRAHPVTRFTKPHGFLSKFAHFRWGVKTNQLHCSIVFFVIECTKHGELVPRWGYILVMRFTKLADLRAIILSNMWPKVDNMRRTATDMKT